MAKLFDKEKLFLNYLSVAQQVFSALEAIFAVDGVCAQIFGDECDDQVLDPDGRHLSEDVKARVRRSGAWQTVSALFDYAVDGVLSGGVDPAEIVMGGAEVLSYLETENVGPAEEWTDVTRLGDGRFALDQGESLDIERVALLANVHVRTVRNAISAGELVAEKVLGSTMVDNASARRWLNDRRGFIPTTIRDAGSAQIEEANSPPALAALVRQRREELDLDASRNVLAPSHPAQNDQILQDLERGMFSAPLDAAFPLADFYQFDRVQFLRAIMRCFFPEQLKVLAETE